MKTETIDDLLERDIDDLVSMADALSADERNVVLTSAAEALVRPSLASRLKLLGFVQALAAGAAPTLRQSAAEPAAIALITAARADDPTERLAALRALAVVSFRAGELTSTLAPWILTAFEHARVDSAAEIRDFANEILSADNPVFRQLISLESAAAVTGKLSVYLEALTHSVPGKK